jgi:hypothetical protein
MVVRRRPSGLFGRRARVGQELGRSGLGRAFGLGPIQKDKICFFLNLFLVRRIIPTKYVNYFKAQKILRKSQKIPGEFPELD